jgi:hypothetical protein
MKLVNIDFIELLRTSYFESKSKLLEEFGYILDNDITINKQIFLYVDKRIKQVIVIICGLDLNLYLDNINFSTITNIVNDSNKIIKDGETNIKKIIDIYNEYNIIFMGHSLGGYIINKNLNNTKYNCYTYNSSFIYEKASENIKNYRTSSDILSIGLIGKETETIELNLWYYLFNKKFDIIQFFKDSHYTTILSLYNYHLYIDIPVYDIE